MRAYSLKHLSDAALLRDLAALAAQDRATTAALLAHIAEVDTRRLYAPAGYASMHAYCVGELRLSEDAASKRIQAARAAREFPACFTMLAEGRLHLTGLRMLAPHLIPANAAELLAAAEHQPKSAIEQMLARRFPQPDAPTLLRAIAPLTNPQHAPGHVETSAPALADEHAPGHVETTAPALAGEHAPGHVVATVPALACELAPGQVAAGPRPRLAPLSAERFVLQVTIDRRTHDKLKQAQALLGHALPSGDVAQVLDRALDALIVKLEKRKFAATDRPRPGRRSISQRRYVPAHVKRAVWERDQGRCTFVGDTGHRCGARKLLEYDHVDPVARGGWATVQGLRLRCRAHNQYEAERVFGAGFMHEKRDRARQAAVGARTVTPGACAPAAQLTVRHAEAGRQAGG